MAVIAPLKGVRYDAEVSGSLEDIVTPPYDVISRNEEAFYRSRSRYNVIRLDITSETAAGRNKKGDRYIKAAAIFKRWLREGVLLRDKEPSIYPYDITYTRPDRTRWTRRGFICLAQLNGPGDGDIKAHEQTVDYAVADRVALTRACRAQFSPVFAVYSDPHDQVMESIGRAPSISIASVPGGDGTVHRLGKITDREIIKNIQTLFMHKSLYLADGHHRYNAALAYKEEMKTSGAFPGYRPEHFIMMYLSPMEGEGGAILSPHRLLRVPGVITVSELNDKLADVFEIEELPHGSRETLINELLARLDEEQCPDSMRRRSCFGFYHPGEDRGFLLKLKDLQWQDLKGFHTSVRDLDVTVFTELIVGKIVQLDEAQRQSENLMSFHTDISDMIDFAVKMTVDGKGFTPLLFLLNPVGTEQVKSLADQGLLMPPKSTRFLPNIITGLVMHRLAEDEKIPNVE